MMRVVIDTNLIISGLFWQGIPARVYDAVITGEFTILVTEQLMAELQRVLHYAKFEPRLIVLGQTPEQIDAALRNLVEIVDPAEVPDNSVRDPKDVPVLSCAVGGKADFIVSGDKDLRVLDSYEGIPILTAEQFLQRLKI